MLGWKLELSQNGGEVQVKIGKDETRRIWIFVVDSRNSEDLRDLDHLEAILWGSNPNTRRGDLILMYRTAPYSDFPYMFVATSDPRPTLKKDHADASHVIELGEKIRLAKPLTLAKIRSSSRLSNWAFAIYQQGIMRRKRDVKEEGVWPSLRLLLTTHNPAVSGLLSKFDTPRSHPRGGLRNASSISAAHGSHSRGPDRRAGQRHAIRLKVFLSYGSEDLRSVRRLHQKLCRESALEPWFDKSGLTPGEEWEVVIKDAISSSDAVVVCLSSRSVHKIGFVQTEIGRALKIADQQPEGTTFIFPAKLEPCEVPKRLSKWQWANLFQKGGYQKLLEGLEKRARQVELSDVLRQ